MEDIEIKLHPEKKPIDIWIDDIERIFKLLPKLKNQIDTYLYELKNSGKKVNNDMALKVQIDGKRKFELTIKMIEDKK